ncbi:G-protein coupled receptor 55 [Pangasianodon hypophthalmus]|uniref:G-protein coupled receptor 55 n=1 Tax=Pangasianodon hypophthalmus TaxID=310915 RepID=UPI00230799F4|nr:G-protein coupled receptor 55 [Pangasianodon hypophthalmus]
MVFNCSVVPNGPEPGLSIFQRVAYTLVFILGLILNTSALWCFTRTRQWTDIHIYMLNLLLADLLLTLFLPFRIFETYCPMSPTQFCTFLICVHYTNMYASVFTITAISIHRYIAVKFPMQNKTSGMSKGRRRKITSGTCAFIWLLVITLCITFRKNMYPEKLKTCYERKGDIRMRLEFLLVLEILGYLVPIVTITTCSIQAIWTVLKSIKDIQQHTEEETIDKRKSIMAIITANMIVFIVCFTPIHAGYLLRYIYDDNCRFVHIFYDVSEWLATTNCCLDSIGYYFLLKKVFRDKK